MSTPSEKHSVKDKEFDTSWNLSVGFSSTPPHDRVYHLMRINEDGKAEGYFVEPVIVDGEVMECKIIDPSTNECVAIV